MKTIRLKRLELRDFQGGTFVLLADGEDVNVHGDNAVGKTRLNSAFSWLLFGRDALGRSDFEIKNLDAQGEAAHGLEHSVEGVLDVDGHDVVLRKVYRELWTKKRGSATSTFSGHTTDFAIDGVPVKEKEYASRIAEITGDESAFRLLTSPMAFPALPWQKQRGLLLEVCGDIQDSDVIATDTRLAPLAVLLEKYQTSKKPFDDAKAVIAARRSEINKELEKVPVRIDEQRRSLPDVQGLDRAVIAADIQGLEAEVSDMRLKLAGVDTGGRIASLSKTLAGVNADIQKMEAGHQSETMKTAARLRQQVTDAEDTLRSRRNRIAAIDTDIQRKTQAVTAIEGDLQKHRATWQAVDAQAFQDATADTCAACGQALPAGRVAEAREKALAEFNARKAERLEDITQTGQRFAAEQDHLKTSIAALQAERAGIEVGTPEALIQSLTAERDAVQKLAEDYTTIPGHAALLAQRADIEAEIKAEREGRATDAVGLRDALAVAQNKLTANKELADRFVRREAGERRIDDLKAEEKRLAAEFERLESELYLCEQFVRTKVSLLTERINSRFEFTRFRLFDQQINGGLSECCEITVQGVPYNAGLNNAGRIQAGCDVIRALQEHYGLRAPIIVDNRESVVALPQMSCQVISLVVSAADKTLRVERVREAVGV